MSNSHRTFGTGSSTCIRAQAVPVHVKLQVKHTNILDLLVKLFPMHRHIVKKPEKHLAALAPAGATWDILALLDIIYLGIWQQSYRLSKQIDCHSMTLDSVTKFVPQHPLTTGQQVPVSRAVWNWENWLLISPSSGTAKRWLPAKSVFFVVLVESCLSCSDVSEVEIGSQVQCGKYKACLNLIEIKK